MYQAPIRSSCRSTALCLLLLALFSVLPGIVRAQADQPKAAPEVAALIAQGGEASKAKKPEEALRIFNAALQKAQMLNDSVGEASALAFLGFLNSTLLQVDISISQLQKALPFFQQHQINKMQAIILVALAQDYIQKKQPDKAAEYAQKTLELKDAPDLADAKKEALRIQKQLLLLKAIGLIQKGDFYRTVDQWPQVIENYGAALPLLEQLGNNETRKLVLGILSFAYMEVGQYQKAMEASEKTLQIRTGVTNQTADAMALTALAAVYVDLGRYAESRDIANRAMKMWRTLGQAQLLATMQMLLGEAYRRQEQTQTALACFAEALPAARKSDNKGLLAACLTYLGNTYRTMKQPEKSLPYYKEAAELFHAVDNAEWEGATLAYQAEVYMAMGQKPRAQHSFQQAVTVLNRALTSDAVTGNHLEEAATLYCLAVAEEELGQLPAAKTHLGQAVTQAELFRADIGGSSDLKVGFFSRILYGLHRNIALLMRTKQPAEAFAMVQKTKARALLDLMANGKVDIRQNLTDAQAKQEQELRKAADALNSSMVQEGVRNEVGSKKRFADLKEQLGQAERALQTYENSLYALHPDLAGKRAASTITLAQAAEFLPDDTALLEFATVYAKEFPDMTGMDQTLLFIVTKQNGAANLRVVPIAVSRVALSQQVEAFRAACADPRKAYQAGAQKLYDLLLRPAAAALEGKKRLLICPDGPLWGLPFAALRDGKQFLLQKYELAYAYSATGERAALAARQRNKPQNTLLALGNPDFGGAGRFGDDKTIPGQRPIEAPSRPIDAPSRPIDAPSRPIDAPSRPIDAPSRSLLLPRGGRITMLPGTQREVEGLRKQIPDAAVYTGAAAQEKVVKQTAGQYRYLHLASHAFFNDASPLLSSIVLAQPTKESGEDGFLTARELFDMNLNADMVVLSACNTARGDKQSGEGVVGLTWALFVAGAPTQVLSQWAVDDASTATLMETFYGHLAQGKGSALRAAELALQSDGKHAHPYYWAPFVLMGDWRK